MLSILIILAIAIAIAIGYKTKINTGLVAIIFAYLIGCFVMGMKPKEIINGWPINIMFIIFSVSFFYNFALVNGTLEKIARLLLYYFRKVPTLLPFALLLVSTCIAALGAGFFTVMAFMAPISLLICKEAKMNLLIGAIATTWGSLVGGNFLISNGGVVYTGLIETAGYGNRVFNYTMAIFLASLVLAVICIVFFRFIFKKTDASTETLSFEKPEPFTIKQKQNLLLILIMVVMVLLFPILKLLIPNAAVISFINSKIDISLIAVIFSVIALLMNLAPQKDVLAKVPWNTIIMICGVNMLINIAIKAGTIEMLAGWVGRNVSTALLPVVITLVAAVMSFFSSVTGVVCPALFPLVPTICAATSISPMLLFVCIVLGAQSSSLSPFSSGGSLILGSCDSEEERNIMFPKLLFYVVPVTMMATIIFNFALGLII